VLAAAVLAMWLVLVPLFESTLGLLLFSLVYLFLCLSGKSQGCLGRLSRPNLRALPFTFNVRTKHLAFEPSICIKLFASSPTDGLPLPTKRPVVNLTGMGKTMLQIAGSSRGKLLRLSRTTVINFAWLIGFKFMDP